jgi:hypothetical protein
MNLYSKIVLLKDNLSLNDLMFDDDFPTELIEEIKSHSDIPAVQISILKYIAFAYDKSSSIIENESDRGKQKQNALTKSKLEIGYKNYQSVITNENRQFNKIIATYLDATQPPEWILYITGLDLVLEMMATLRDGMTYETSGLPYDQWTKAVINKGDAFIKTKEVMEEIKHIKEEYEKEDKGVHETGYSEVNKGEITPEMMIKRRKNNIA